MIQLSICHMYGVDVLAVSIQATSCTGRAFSSCVSLWCIAEWFSYPCITYIHTYMYSLGGASFVAQLVKNPPTMQETWVQSLGWEDSPEKGKATHSSILDLENSMDCIVHGVTKSQT